MSERVIGRRLFTDGASRPDTSTVPGLLSEPVGKAA
jgi:hypothetical protein